MRKSNRKGEELSLELDMTLELVSNPTQAGLNSEPRTADGQPNQLHDVWQLNRSSRGLHKEQFSPPAPTVRIISALTSPSQIGRLQNNKRLDPDSGECNCSHQMRLWAPF